jgi:hypothetical protein
MIFDGNGPDKKLVPRQDKSSLVVTGEWKDGRWRVLIKRALKEGELSFSEGQFIPVSFANWDGSNGELGSRHTLTSWYWLLLPPSVDPMKVFGLPLGVAFLTFLLGVVLVRSQRGYS